MSSSALLSGDVGRNDRPNPDDQKGYADDRPKLERTVAGRYFEPSLLDCLRKVLESPDNTNSAS